MCGYEFQSNIVEAKDTDKEMNMDEHLQYPNLKTLTYEEMEAINYKINHKQATELEKMQYEKYWFNKLIKPDNVEIPVLHMLFQKYYLSSQKKELLKNIVDEHKGDIEHLILTDCNQSGSSIEANPLKALRLQKIIEIKEKLGLANTYSDGHVVKRETVEK
jgi:hypothetical protein